MVFISTIFVLLATVALGAQAPQESQYVERVEVARVLIDARVVDKSGQPVLGLEAADFEVQIDDTQARVEAVEWIGSESTDLRPLPSTDLAGALEPVVRGRLVVLLVQKSMQRHRIMGLLKMVRDGGGLLARLTREDRVALLSFDSHLRIWLDFTGNMDRVRRVLADDVMFRSPEPVEPAPEPSLVSRLSQEVGRRTYTMDEALRLLGNALEPLPGAKSIILIGYGFGRLTFTLGGFGAALDDSYDEARSALQAARVSVFCLDVTDADYHTLEFGLETVAADTGGLFARAYRFPRQALDRVSSALVGHYVLFAEKPDIEPGEHSITVRLARSEGTVLARSGYRD